MRFQQSTIDEIKYRNPIEDVVSQYVALKRAGNLLTGLCPFHSEKSPSFMVYTGDEPHFYCFGCGAGGDVITFIRRIENLEYPDAVRFLAKRAGIPIPEEMAAPETGVKRSRILEMNRDAARFFHGQLKVSEPALAYLAQRGLSPATVTHFGLGYAPDSFGALLSHMTGLGYTEEELKTGFLCGVSQKTGRPFDYFRGRVIFPIIDTSGDVVAFGGRVIGDGKPKYLNTSDTPAFKKSKNLFALNFARNVCGERMILCEGYMDVVSLHAAGFGYAVATLGTAITPEQARIMARYTKKVIISYDSDEAGQNAAEKAFRLLGEVGLETRILKMEGAKDPDEYIKKYGAEKFRTLLDGSRSRFEFRLEDILSRYDLTQTEEKIKAAGEATDLLAAIWAPVERDLYTSRAASALDISAELLKKDVERKQRQSIKTQKKEELREAHNAAAGYRDPVNPEASRDIGVTRTEAAIIGLLLLRPDLLPTAEQTLRPEDFGTAFHRRVYENLLEDRAVDGEKYTPDELSRLTQLRDARGKLTVNNETALRDLIGGLRGKRESASLSTEELLARKRGQ